MSTARDAAITMFGGTPPRTVPSVRGGVQRLQAFTPPPPDTRPRPHLPPLGFTNPDTTSGGSNGGSGPQDDFSTLADAYSHALSMQPVSTQDATPTVIMDPNAGSGNGMNVKGIVIILAVAGLAWFVWKKWGKGAVAEAAS